MVSRPACGALVFRSKRSAPQFDCAHCRQAGRLTMARQAPGVSTLPAPSPAVVVVVRTVVAALPLFRAPALLGRLARLALGALRSARSLSLRRALLLGLARRLPLGGAGLLGRLALGTLLCDRLLPGGVTGRVACGFLRLALLAGFRVPLTLGMRRLPLRLLRLPAGGLLLGHLGGACLLALLPRGAVGGHFLLPLLAAGRLGGGLLLVLLLHPLAAVRPALLHLLLVRLPLCLLDREGVV